ncbi:MAG TPA: RHS repeat-associated core domain-containing protein, partial [Thermoanaerobaculia bacterium]
FDAADRLIETTDPEKHTVYTYDGVGDRLTEKVRDAGGAPLADKTFTYDERHRLTALADAVDASRNVTYGYDANGNQVARTQGAASTQFTFDARNQLLAIRRGGALLGRYGYDYRGLRVTKQGAAGLLQSTYDGRSLLVQTDPTGTTIAKFDYGSDRLLSLQHAVEGRQFYLFDALRSVTDLTSLDGTARASYRFDAWGALRAKTGGSFNGFGFTGHEQDQETGLYYFQARYYDPELGRFLSEDPAEGAIANPPSLHRYLYAYANPTVYVDPDGRFSLKEAWDAVAAGAEIYLDTVKNNAASVPGLAASAAKSVVNVLDFATLGSISAGEKQVKTFLETKGTLREKAEAAENVSTLEERLHVMSLGFSDAPDKVEHLKELTGADQIQASYHMYREAWAERDWEKALRATGLLGGGVAQVASLVDAGLGIAKSGLAGAAVQRAVVRRTATAIEKGAEALSATAESTTGRSAVVTEETPAGSVGARPVAPAEGVPATQCFVAGTLVTTARGLISIEQIRVGELVLSKDEATGELAWKPVVRVFVTPDQPVLRLTLRGEDGNEEPLGVTAG